MSRNESTTKNIVNNIIEDNMRRLRNAADKLGIPLDDSDMPAGSKLAPWRDEDACKEMLYRWNQHMQVLERFGNRLEQATKFHPTPAQRAVREAMREQQADADARRRSALDQAMAEAANRPADELD